MYPVDLDGKSLMHAGLASDDEQALRIARDIFSGSEWDPSSISVHLATKEIGSTYRTREEFESVWAKEIAEGWVSAIQIFSGWKGQADPCTWRNGSAVSRLGVHAPTDEPEENEVCRRRSRRWPSRC